MLDLISSALSNLKGKLARTILTLLGVAIGVSSVIIVSSISETGTNVLMNEFDSLGLSGLTISTDVNQSVKLGEKELQVIKNNTYVAEASPLIMQSGEVGTNKTKTEGMLCGIADNAAEIVSVTALYGRTITQADVASYSKVCLVDEKLANTLYKRDNIIGKNVTIYYNGKQEEFLVIGISKTGSGLLQNIIGDYMPSLIYIPYTTMQELAGRDTFDQVAIKTQNTNDLGLAGSEIVEQLNRANDLSDGYIANNLAKQKDSLLSILNIISVILSAVGVISLLVASLSIMTVMMVSVNERIREIGIKKAIGAKPRTILTGFLVESILMTGIGCIAGLAISGILILAATFLFQIEISFPWCSVFMTIIFSVLSGGIFGIYPAMKAARLNPVDALRIE